MKKLANLAKFAAILGIFAFVFGFAVSCDNGSNDDSGTDPATSPDNGTNSETGDNNENGTDTSTALASGAKIYIVGDSTVCDYIKTDGTHTDNYFLPRYGWGTQLHEYLNVQKSQVVNLALSGRSSKSFLTESNYTKLTTDIKSGDYLIIGFGHNDEKNDDNDRFTDPTGTKDTETTEKGTSLKWNFYEKYIKMAKDKGATPILCTPITRYDSSGAYSGSKVHVTSDGDYPKAIIELGAETNTTVIDLTKLTIDVYKADNDAAKFYHAHTSYSSAKKDPPYDGTETPDGPDETHINMFGAKMVCYQFAQALKDTDCALKSSVKTNKSAPTKAKDYVEALNNGYKKPDYAPFVPSENSKSKLATASGADWYKTAFGDIGGASKVSSFASTYSDDKFKIAVTGNQGKFAAGADGMGAIFTQIPIGKNFTASVKAKVTVVPTKDSDNDTKVPDLSNQNAFGLILRDDIHIDKYDASLATNYVAACVTGGNKAIMSRASGTLTVGSDAMNLATDTEYELSIVRVGQTVDVTVKQGSTTFTKKFTDFDFVAVDNDYFYLCMFANRGLTVEFSDLSFAITGDSQGA